MPNRPLTTQHPHAQFVHKQFQTAVQALNKRYANSLSPEQMTKLQFQGPTATSLAPRTLATPTPPSVRPLTSSIASL